MKFDKSPNLKYQAVTVNSERKLRKSAKIFPVMIVNIETNIYLCYV